MFNGYFASEPVIGSQKAVLYAGFFSVQGPPEIRGPIFDGRYKILLLGKAIKFAVIFQKYALKL